MSRRNIQSSDLPSSVVTETQVGADNGVANGTTGTPPPGNTGAGGGGGGAGTAGTAGDSSQNILLFR